MPKLELFVSPPGTGKTTECIDLFREQVSRSGGGIDSRAYFILPSREHAERIQNLVLKKGAPGLFNAHILTIADLTDRVLRTGGRPTDSARRRALEEILSARDEKGESVYGYFRDSLGFRGFQELALEAIREFKAGLLSVAEFEKRAQPLLKDPVFRSKFRDFSVLIKRYDAHLEALGLAEAEDELAAIQTLEDPGAAPELVIFDGFYHFTRAQLKFLTLVAGWSRHTVVTLTLDKAHRAGPVLFGYPERTRLALTSLGFKERTDFTENHRSSHPALRHLAGCVFAPDPAKYENQAPLTVISAPFLRTEYEMIAAEIRRLYREETFHFSDICLILRAVSGQKALIESVFSEYEIPVEIHERSRYSESGLAVSFHRLLRLAAEGWKREDVLHLAKSSYLNGRLSMAGALELEHSALREGVREARENWVRLAQSGETSPEGRQFLDWLLQLEAQLLGAKSAHAFGALVTAFLSSLKAGGSSTLDEAAFQALISILMTGRKRHLESGTPFEAPRYAREILAAIENSLFSPKIHGRNRVQVYDVVMALPKEYKVVFICDLVEKTFPQAPIEDPLFKDAQRRVINAGGTVLDERAWRLSGERYFFYMALTRAKERLYLAHSTHDSDGSPSLESFFIGEALACFGKDSVRRITRSVSHFLPERGQWESEADVARGLAALLFQGGSRRSLADLVPAGWKARPMLERAAEYAAGETFGLKDPRVREAMASWAVPFSATGLEAFLLCPFRYFAEQALQLNGPLEGRENAQMGTLLHETLREYFEGLTAADRASGLYLREPGRMEAQLEKIFLRRFEEGPFRDQPRYRQIAWRESMRRMLKKYVKLELGAESELRPQYFEYDFGKGGKGKSGYLRLADKSGEILIRGSIDRVDVDASGKNAVVIDYKRSSRNLNKKLKDGDEIQLPLYLLAVQRLLDLEPAGLEHRILKSGRRESPDLSPEDIQMLLDETEERVRQAVRRIRSGEIKVEPKDCTFCEFDAVCRVQTKRGHEF